MKRTVLILAVLLFGAAFFINSRVHKVPLKKTYFSYTSDETATLKGSKSDQNVSVGDIYLWNQKTFRLVGSNKLSDVDASRVYAYLAVAQRDFAVLSYNSTGSYTGSISVISQKLLCRFFAEDCKDIIIEEKSDALTTKVSDLVMKRVNERIMQDNAGTVPFSLRTGKDLWSGQQPSTGIDAMNRLPWHLKNSQQFRAPAPPNINSDEYKKMLGEVKDALKNITDEQRAAVVFWAGGPGTKTPPGIWLNIADQYMKETGADPDVDLVLNVHADISTAMADAVIAVFDSKYTYQQKRPFMLDSTIDTVMPTPNHPSYPAGHATISGAAQTILTYYFPEKKDEWLKTANEAADTRVWGGIHFPIDNVSGLSMGEKVAGQTLDQYK